MQAQWTLKQLEYFVAAAETGTIRAAAERCHVSPVGLGVALTELERALGTQLLHRRRAKGVVLTPEGRVVLPIARAIIVQATELQLKLNAHSDAVTGTLHVGCLTGIASMLMPDVCDTFAKQHPALSIDFREGTQDALYAALEGGDLEAAFLYERDLPETLDYVRVIEMKPYVIVAADHRLAHRTSVDLRELADEPLIRLSIPPMSDPSSWSDHMDAAPREAYTVSSVELMRTLVGRGLGYAVLGQRSPMTVTAEGLPIRELEITDHIPTVRVVLAFARGMRLPPRARALAEFARALPPARQLV
ncbi:LysR family transcriptional regulator [Leucobacter allii]|uniref:LysR family transcriptional regulator n=1 Tax=Leucobacter allii TaxID=2932247 RepID=UPI001FD418EE|nr:LysR family transcriptional regulator [Leucobacter allii]UOR01895.1 LysR family transcriptional regulator [Leucobacter allii]